MTQPPTVATLRALEAEGLSLPAIAKQLNADPAEIKRRLRRGKWSAANSAERSAKRASDWADRQLRSRWPVAAQRVESGAAGRRPPITKGQFLALADPLVGILLTQAFRRPEAYAPTAIVENTRHLIRKAANDENGEYRQWWRSWSVAA